MADDTQRLIVSLEARIDKFQKALDRANGTANKRARQIETRFSQMNRSVSASFASFGKGLGAGALAALAPMALLQTALNEIEKASHLVDTADKIGLTTTALQELTFGFEQAGVEASTFETSMAQFSKRIGEAATRGGQLADIFATNGVALRDSNGQIRSSESLLAEYADLVKNAASEQEKMLLVTEAFGRAGGDMLNGLNQGASGIRNMKAEAEKAGGVIDEQLLRRAEELGDRWEAGWRRFKLASSNAILTAIEGMDDLSSRMDRFLEKRNAVEAGEMLGGMAGQTGSGKGDRLSADNRINKAFLGEVIQADEALVEALRKRYGVAATKATVIPGESEGGGGGSKTKEDTFKPDSDAFAEMIGYTRDYRREQELANRQMEEFGNLASSAGMQLADALSDGKLTGEELIPILENVVSELVRMGVVAKLVQSLLGGIGGGFNPTSGGFADMLGFASGGYTGSGPKNKPTGVVHAGEVVFSQDDVRRHGGVGAVESMRRRGMPSYAVGGPVGVPRIAGPGGGRSDDGLSVVINNAPPGTTAREDKQRGPDGAVMRRLVVDIVDQHIASGGADKSFGTRYGAQPRKTVR